jgi:predicted site-specific integrase-resolvase
MESLTTTETAKHFRKSVATIRRWVRLGLLRPIQHCKPYQFPKNEITRRENQLKPSAIY